MSLTEWTPVLGLLGPFLGYLVAFRRDSSAARIQAKAASRDFMLQQAERLTNEAVELRLQVVEQEKELRAARRAAAELEADNLRLRARLGHAGDQPRGTTYEPPT